MLNYFFNESIRMWAFFISSLTDSLTLFADLEWVWNNERVREALRVDSFPLSYSESLSCAHEGFELVRVVWLRGWNSEGQGKGISDSKLQRAKPSGICLSDWSERLLFFHASPHSVRPACLWICVSVSLVVPQMNLIAFKATAHLSSEVTLSEVKVLYRGSI